MRIVANNPPPRHLAKWPVAFRSPTVTPEVKVRGNQLMITHEDDATGYFLPDAASGEVSASNSPSSALLRCRSTVQLPRPHGPLSAAWNRIYDIMANKATVSVKNQPMLSRRNRRVGNRKADHHVGGLDLAARKVPISPDPCLAGDLMGIPPFRYHFLTGGDAHGPSPFGFCHTGVLGDAPTWQDRQHHQEHCQAPGHLSASRHSTTSILS